MSYEKRVSTAEETREYSTLGEGVENMNRGKNESPPDIAVVAAALHLFFSEQELPAEISYGKTNNRKWRRVISFREAPNKWRTSCINPWQMAGRYHQFSWGQILFG